MSEQESYYHSMPEREFGDFCVAFVDCLGFAHAVNSHMETATCEEDVVSLPLFRRLKHLHAQAISSKSTQVGNPDWLNIQPRFRVFSDSAFIYLPNSAEGIRGLIGLVQGLTVMLAQHGFFVRGAIAVGKLFASQDVVIGPAINEAARLEKFSYYPRVILSEQAAKLSAGTELNAAL